MSRIEQGISRPVRQLVCPINWKALSATVVIDEISNLL